MVMFKRSRRSYFLIVCVLIAVLFIFTQFNLILKTPLNISSLVKKVSHDPLTMLSTSKVKPPSPPAGSALLLPTQRTTKATAQDLNNRLDTIKVVKDKKTIVLVIACNRVSISRCLDLIIKYRPSKELYPIVVSQDCSHTPTEDIIKSYGDQLTLIKHTNKSPIKIENVKLRKFTGYYKISRHYLWALTQVFDGMKANAVIVIEDDLEISSDFFSYFSYMYPVLLADDTLYCISAWNDNGMTKLIEKDAELLYRTDFFPGLGWMLTDTLWKELKPIWPASFWDDWMRETNVRRNRSCIRPEVPRTSTFGNRGISNGLFYEKVLKYVIRNDVFVDFSKLNLSYLFKNNYDAQFTKAVYDTPVIGVLDLKKETASTQPVRLEYTSIKQFSFIAKSLNIMNDERSNVPRTAYKGIVSFMYNKRRVYLTPKQPWSPY